jgi:hypothetical protein
MLDDDPEPPTPEQLEARQQLMREIDAPPDLEGLIREFIKQLEPPRGFAIG